MAASSSKWLICNISKALTIFPEKVLDTLASPKSLGCEKDDDIKGQPIISISGSIFLFWEFTRVALNDSQIKIILLYHILDLGAAP